MAILQQVIQFLDMAVQFTRAECRVRNRAFDLRMRGRLDTFLVAK